MGIYDALRDATRFLQLEDIVTFTGRVSHDEVNKYYSLIDIAPLPRKDSGSVSWFLR